MRKMQILFPEPMLRRLQEVSRVEDRPVSELVRRAVDRFLEQVPEAGRGDRRFPTFHGGGVLVAADRIKQEIYADDDIES